MEVIDGNDGALAAGIAVPAMMQSFVCSQETSHVGTTRAHIVQKALLKEMHTLPNQDAPGRGERSN